MKVTLRNWVRCLADFVTGQAEKVVSCGDTIAKYTADGTVWVIRKGHSALKWTGSSSADVYETVYDWMLHGGHKVVDWCKGLYQAVAAKLRRSAEWVASFFKKAAPAEQAVIEAAI